MQDYLRASRGVILIGWSQPFPTRPPKRSTVYWVWETLEWAHNQCSLSLSFTNSKHPTAVRSGYARSLQSCPTLCDPIDGSTPGSPVPGILQARILEWGAIAFSIRSGMDPQNTSQISLSFSSVLCSWCLSLSFSCLAVWLHLCMEKVCTDDSRQGFLYNWNLHL